MQQRQPRYSKEEHARRGTEMYERLIRRKVEATQAGEVVALDIDTGEYEVAYESLTAAQRLLACFPDAQIWCVRVGQPAVHRFGALAAR